MSEQKAELKPCVWSNTPPTEQGTYWHWNGDDDSAPIHVEVFYSGHTGTCFLPAGQYGWTEAQDVTERGGWWMPLRIPPTPSERTGPNSDWVSQWILDEINHAFAKHGRAQWGRHEFYAILKEEVDELWDDIKRDSPQENVRKEAIQVAAMVYRYLITGDRYREPK